MSASLKAWLESGDYLPDVMRDFHDQKDVFKTIDQWADRVPVHGVVERDDGRPYSLDWMTAHVFTIDRFLYFMAAHGYVLRRSRAKLTFASLDASIDERRERDAEVFRQVLVASRPSPTPPSPEARETR